MCFYKYGEGIWGEDELCVCEGVDVGDLIYGLEGMGRQRGVEEKINKGMKK